MITKDCRKFRLLSGFERGIVLDTIVGLTAAKIGLRLAGFQRWKKVVRRLTRVRLRSGVAMPSAGLAAKIARIAEAAAHRLPFGTNCLERSLVLLWLLRRRGIAADLRLGARKEFNRFEAHAWVEFQGAILNDAGDEHLHFVPFEGAIKSLETQTH